MDRRRTVAWAGGLSVALVLGSGLVALGAGAFAEPPVDRVGSFQSINAEFTPSSTTGPAGTDASSSTVRRSQPEFSRPGDETTVEEPASRGMGVTDSSAPPATAPLVAPTSTPDAESHDTTTVRSDTTTSSKPDDAHDPPEHEPPDD